MMRRMAVGSVAAALLVMVLAGCGGSSASPSASAAASAAAGESPAVTEAPVGSGAAATTPQPASSTAGTTSMVALCAGVGVRKGPTTGDKVLVRLAKGVKVRVVESVTGDPYTAGACGAAGDDWVKIDRINGKSVKTLYGVSYGYAAGGFFQ